MIRKLISFIKPSTSIDVFKTIDWVKSLKKKSFFINYIKDMVVKEPILITYYYKQGKIIMTWNEARITVSAETNYEAESNMKVVIRENWNRLAYENPQVVNMNKEDINLLEVLVRHIRCPLRDSK